MINDLGFHIFVNVLSSRYELDSNVCAFVKLVLRQLNETKRSSIQIFAFFIPFVIC